jgi:transcription elongation GreA/GreB family factor
VNKSKLVQAIIEHLRAELELFTKAARAAHAEATHEQSKAENKYDTRGLEAAYLARGQSKQASEAEQAIKQFEALRIREFTKSDPIDVGALVELRGRGEPAFYFIGPRAGGVEVLFGEREVTVITPQSPLGQQLYGRKQGEQVQIDLAGTRDKYRIVSVV